MIARLAGSLVLVEPGAVVVESGGVGYLVSIGLRTYRQLAGRENAALWIHTRVRDEAIELYGFTERDELAAFERLISVAGVGPRTALAVLSAMTPSQLVQAVEGGEAEVLEKTPGVGPKTARRIVLELAGRLEVTATEVGDQRSDAVSALVNLGYPRRDAQRAVDGVSAVEAAGDLGELLRLALKRLTR